MQGTWDDMNHGEPCRPRVRALPPAFRRILESQSRQDRRENATNPASVPRYRPRECTFLSANGEPAESTPNCCPSPVAVASHRCEGDALTPSVCSLVFRNSGLGCPWTAEGRTAAGCWPALLIDGGMGEKTASSIGRRGNEQLTRSGSERRTSPVNRWVSQGEAAGLWREKRNKKELSAVPLTATPIWRDLPGQRCCDIPCCGRLPGTCRSGPSVIGWLQGHGCHHARDRVSDLLRSAQVHANGRTRQ